MKLPILKVRANYTGYGHAVLYYTIKLGLVAVLDGCLFKVEIFK